MGSIPLSSSYCLSGIVIAPGICPFTYFGRVGLESIITKGSKLSTIFFTKDASTA